MKERLGVAVIGSGRAGMVHARNFARKVRRARLVALMDQKAERVKEKAHELEVDNYYTELDQVLSDPEVDAVVIGTPTFTHAEIASVAARAGKDILCEKPLAISLEEADKISAAVEDSGVHFMVGFMRRFASGFVEARERIVAGEIGEVMTVKSTGRGPGLPPRWALDPELSNGNLAEVNSHDFDAIRWLTDSEYQSVFTRGGNFKSSSLEEDFPEFYDNAVVSFELTDGTIGTVDGTCPADYGYDARMEILGSDGVLFVGEVAKRGVAICTTDRGFQRKPVDSWQNLFSRAYEREDRHFVDSVLEDEQPKVTLEDGRKALEVVLAANRSLRKEREVEI